MIGEQELSAAFRTLEAEGLRRSSSHDWLTREGLDPEAVREVGNVLTSVCIEECAEEAREAGRQLTVPELRAHVWETVMTAFELGWIARRDA
jgi:hypothetical protein